MGGLPGGRHSHQPHHHVVQVLTSLQDSTVSTVPRLFAVEGATLLLMPWMVHGFRHSRYKCCPISGRFFGKKSGIVLWTVSISKAFWRQRFSSEPGLPDCWCSCPALVSDAIPVRLKATLVLLITALLYPLRGPMHLGLTSWQWAGVASSEVVIGAGTGAGSEFHDGSAHDGRPDSGCADGIFAGNVV